MVPSAPPVPTPLRVKELLPERLTAALYRDPGSFCRWGAAIRGVGGRRWRCRSDATRSFLERLADDLSGQFQILRAPTVEYGCVASTGGAPPGGVVGGVVRKMTLHRLLSDLLASWETAGVREFVVLSADGSDAHQEALATVVTAEARVRVVDVFGIPLGDVERDDARGIVLRYLQPTLARGNGERPGGVRADGRALYEQIRTCVAERVLADSGVA